MLGADLSCELKNDYEVSGLDAIRRQKSAAHRFYQCNIADKKDVLGVTSRVKPRIVIHAAAWTDVDGCELNAEKAYKVNYEGTKNIAAACKKVKALLIYISTDFVFDGKKKTAYKEKDKPGPINIYGDSKLKGEEAVKKVLKKYFILRTSWLYGRHGSNFVDTILEKAKKELTLKVVDDQIGSPTYTKDLSKAIHALLGKIRVSGIGYRVSGCGIYHISNSGNVSWYQYTKEILRLAGSETKVIPISSKESARPARRPAMSILDNLKFNKFTGYRMRHWKEALKEYLS